MNLIVFLQETKLTDLDLPENILNKLETLGHTEFKNIYLASRIFRSRGKSNLSGISETEMKVIDAEILRIMRVNGLAKPQATTSNKVAHPISVPRTTQSSSTSKSPAKRLAQHASPVRPTPTPSLLSSSPLAAWEAQLAPMLAGVELIGEIPLSEEDVTQISKHIRTLFERHQIRDVLDAIARQYSATFLAFMVGQGIYAYYSGEFWPAVDAALGQTCDHVALGRLFEQLLQRFEKPVFRDLQEKSLRYVSQVLAHGGIPVYCLKDFFSNIVLPSALRPQLVSLEGEELAEEILKHTTYTANTDKPILYFLEYGGKTAANLLDRSRRMLSTWQHTQAAISASDAGLPAHIVHFFNQWALENAALVAAERGPRTRLKKPVLCLDPWGLGIFIYLPSQPVSALSASAYAWKVDTGNYQDQFKARTQRKGDQIETREVTLSIHDAPETVSIQFIQKEDITEWKIRGYAADHQILAFDPATGYLQNHIIGREMWLLYPKHFSLVVTEGNGSRLEVMPTLPGEWAKFKVECWDLSETIRVGLFQQDQLFREIYIKGQEKTKPPFLHGGNLVPTDLEADPTPVYSGSIPQLVIPFSGDSQQALTRWKIHLENDGLAVPTISARHTISELSADILDVRSEQISLRLDHPQLLGSHPTGTYRLILNGPLGSDVNFVLRVLPECNVTGLDTLVLPNPKPGDQKATFSLQTNLLDDVSCIKNAEGLRLQTERPGLYRVEVPGEISSVALTILRETVAHQFIHIPLMFRVKRLRWRFVEESGPVENWLQQPRTLPVQALVQEQAPFLIIDLPGNDNGQIELHLRLRDAHDQVIQELKTATRSSKWKQRFWRFDLAQIKSNINVYQSPAFRLDIVGIDTTTEQESFATPVLILTQSIRIHHPAVEVYASQENYHVLVTWHEKIHLNSRALVLWSLFQPWQAPIIESIPDAALDEHEFSLSAASYAGGVYRGCMVVLDPWVPYHPSPFPTNSGETASFELTLSSPQERLASLERGISSRATGHIAQFRDRLEISIIRQYLGELSTSQKHLQSCCRHLALGSWREIIILKTLLDVSSSTTLRDEFSQQLIQPNVIGKLVDAHKSEEINEQDLLTLLAYLPEVKHWPVQSCEILVSVDDPEIQIPALTQLLKKDVRKAVANILSLIVDMKLTVEDAVELMFEEKTASLAQLQAKENIDPVIGQLINLLEKYNPYSGLPIVRPGSWVLTNVGWGRIEEIQESRSRFTVESFIVGDGQYLLAVKLNIYESEELIGENALIDMATQKITFPRAKRLFTCQHCQNFTTANLSTFRTHLVIAHGSTTITPGQQPYSIPLTHVQFNLTPTRQNRNSS